VPDCLIAPNHEMPSMLIFRARSLSGTTSRRRRSRSQFRVETLEARTMLSLTAINFGATVSSTPVAMNGVLYFSATESAHGSQLWSSNGTSSGTVMLTDVNPKYGGLNPSDLTVVGNTLYFIAE
jgi:ELWxxDGT repeat protein